MSALASANRASLAYIAESAFGVTPGSGTAKALRMTGESFDFALSKEVSKEIRSDRQNTGAVTVDGSTSGGFQGEMQYREYDAFIAAALGSAYGAYGTDGVSTTFTAAITTTDITASVAPVGANAFTNLQKGQWFRLLAPTDANNGKFFKVSTITAPTTTVITLDASTPGIAAASVANSVVQTSRLTNGVTETTFSIERALADITQYMLFRGQAVSKMDWKFAASSLSTLSFDFMGKDMVRATSTGLPSAPAASQTFDIQNGVRGIGQLWEGTVPLTGTYIKSLDLSVDNNLRAQTALQNFGAVGIGWGTLKVSGSYEAYFANGDLFDKFLADTYSGLTVGTQDKDNNGYVVTLPRCQTMTHKVVAGSRDTDIMAQVTFEAFADTANATSALRKTIFIDRVGVAAV